MDKKLLKVGMAATAFFLFFLIVLGSRRGDKIVSHYSEQDGVAPIPLVHDSNPVTRAINSGEPQEQRDENVRKWLAPGLKISVSAGSGSGTIIYHDPATNIAYVASCGHLWEGTKKAEELKANPVKCEVTTWYKNNTKLDQPKNYPADVVFWSNDRGFDTSLVKFQPDWVPDYFPIGSLDYQFSPGQHLHSVGCDGGREIAHYEVDFVEMRERDIITKNNSPRPGRSGGGLMNDAGLYVGTCWGTSDRNGSGIGYFTPLASIHKIWQSNDCGWLLGVSKRLDVARQIRIFDPLRPDAKFPLDFIPLPGTPTPTKDHRMP